MFTRLVECTVKLEQKEDFTNVIAAQVLPALSRQPGFVDVIGFISDDRADHAYVLTFWKTKADAERFYPHASPETELLAPLLQGPPAVEALYVTTSAMHRLAEGKAA